MAQTFTDIFSELKGVKTKPSPTAVPAPTTTANNFTELFKQARTGGATPLTAEPKEVRNLPEFLGGGAYYKGFEPDTRESKQYGGLEIKTGYQRNDIVPRSLGGADTPFNIQYQKLSEAQKRDDYETFLATEVRAGRMTKGEAIVKAKGYDFAQPKSFFEPIPDKVRIRDVAREAGSKVFDFFGKVGQGLGKVGETLFKAPGQVGGAVIGGAVGGLGTALQGESPFSKKGLENIKQTAKTTSEFGGSVTSSGIPLGVAAVTPGLSQVVGVAFGAAVAKDVYDSLEKSATQKYQGMPTEQAVELGLKDFGKRGWQRLGLDETTATKLQDNPLFSGVGVGLEALLLWGAEKGISGGIYRSILKNGNIVNKTVTELTTDQFKTTLKENGINVPDNLPAGRYRVTVVEPTAKGKLIQPLEKLGTVKTKIEFKPTEELPSGKPQIAPTIVPEVQKGIIPQPTPKTPLEVAKQPTTVEFKTKIPAYKRVLNGGYITTKDAWGNEFVQVKGTLPDIVKERVEPRQYSHEKPDITIEQFNNAEAKPTKIIDIGPQSTNPKIEMVRFKVGKNVDVYANKEYVNLVLKHYPEAQIFGTTAESPLIFRVNGKIVGTVMPILDAKIKKIEPVLAGGKGASVGTYAEVPPEPVTKVESGLKFTEGDKTRGTFAETPIELGGMDTVKALEMPEIVRLAKELGNYPSVTKLRGLRRGQFSAIGGIELDPAIFKDSTQATKTLAHEIGHLVDYLPENLGKPSTMFKKLLAIKEVIKEMFGKVTVNSKTIRQELKTLSTYWRPYDEANVSGWFKQYRNSSNELYADAISVLLNSPGTLQRIAPTFYKIFFDTLDRKPDVKEAYFGLQELLRGAPEETLEARKADLRSGFNRAENLQKDFAAKRKAANKAYWEKLRQQLDDINYPILKKIHQLEVKGVEIPDDMNPKFLLEELSLVDNENFLLVKDLDDNVIKPIEQAGMTIEDLGEYLLLQRIINERQEIANPYGFTPATASRQLDYLKQGLGEKKFNLLSEKAQIFHDYIFKSVEEAVRVGSYNKELFETKIKPNKNTYAAFGVVDYMQEWVPATVKASVGTLKEVANPFVVTLLKTISLNRLNALQRAKNGTIKLLQDNFKEDIKPSKTLTTDGKLRIFKVEKDRGGLEVLEDGKLKSYDVDPYIAEIFKHSKVGDLNVLVSLLDKFNNNFFKPIVTTYNLGFAAAFNPMRDIKRNYKLIKGSTLLPFAKVEGKWKFTTVGNLLVAYVKNLGRASQYSKGQIDDFTRSLVESKAITAPINDYNYDPREDHFGRILQRYHLLPKDQPESSLPIVITKTREILLKPIIKILEGIRYVANTLEIVSKIAGAEVRKQLGESGRVLSNNLRNFTGTPNWMVKGEQSKTTNAIWVFSNIMKEGIKSDLKIATDPKTRSGYWWKTVKIDFLPKLFMILASAGLLGPVLKKFYDKISEYDKTNYIILPLGFYGSNDEKAVYMRIPHDETGRLLSAVFWKIANFARTGNADAWQQVMAVGAGQMPNLTPAISIGTNWFDYLSGKNPYDSFRGRNVIDDVTWQAGGSAALKKMVQWTANALGLTKFATYDRSTNTGLETFLQVTPWFSSLFKISNYGEQESLKGITNATKQEEAQTSLEKRDIVQKYATRIRVEGLPFNDTIINNISKEIYGTNASSSQKVGIKKALANTIIKQTNDPNLTVFTSVTSNQQKLELLKSIKDKITPEVYIKVVNTLKRYGLISKELKIP